MPPLIMGIHRTSVTIFLSEKIFGEKNVRINGFKRGEKKVRNDTVFVDEGKCGPS